MDSVFTFVASFIVCAFFTYLDGEESQKTENRGGHEWNPFVRDGQRKFTLARYVIFNAIFFVGSVAAYIHQWGVGSDPSVATNWQPAVTLFLLSGGHVFGFFVNQSKVKQLEWRAANPAAPGEIRLPL